MAPDVKAVNVASGLPFADGAFKAVYHSHVLEHLDRVAARKLLGECFRVLEPGGVLRIAVPDLERIATDYLARLAEARARVPGAKRRYEWAMLELCDQMTRRKNGGGMIDFLTDIEPSGRAYAEKCCGAETRLIIEKLDRRGQSSEIPVNVPKTLRDRVRAFREKLAQYFFGKDYAALQEGRFCVSGELHRWMYDSFSLSDMLVEIGFGEICEQAANESTIEDWTSFVLDSDFSNLPHKPDSLFIEACKPDALKRQDCDISSSLKINSR